MGVVTTTLIGAEAVGPSGKHCRMQCRNQLLGESLKVHGFGATSKPNAEL